MGLVVECLLVADTFGALNRKALQQRINPNNGSRQKWNRNRRICYHFYLFLFFTHLSYVHSNRASPTFLSPVII